MVDSRRVIERWFEEKAREGKVEVVIDKPKEADQETLRRAIIFFTLVMMIGDKRSHPVVFDETTNNWEWLKNKIEELRKTGNERFGEEFLLHIDRRLRS